MPFLLREILQNSNFIFSSVMVPNILVLLTSLGSETKSVLPPNKLLEESQEVGNSERVQYVVPASLEKIKFEADTSVDAAGENGEKDLKREEKVETMQKVRGKRAIEKYQPKPPTLELTRNGVLSTWEVPEHLRGSRNHVMVLQLLNSSTIEADKVETAAAEEEGYGASHPWGEVTKEIGDAGPDNVISVLIPVSKFLSGQVTMVRLAVRDVDYELSKPSTLVRLRDIKIGSKKGRKKKKVENSEAAA